MCPRKTSCSPNLPPRAKGPEKEMHWSWGQSPGAGVEERGPQAQRGCCGRGSGSPLYTPPSGQVGQQSHKPKGGSRINNEPFPWGLHGWEEAPARLQVGGWEQAQKWPRQRRQQGLGLGCRWPSPLTPPHPQSLGIGRAPWMMTQKPGCQQLLPGTVHIELHCFL